MNNITENSLEQPAQGLQREADDVVLLAVDEPLDAAVGIVELVDHLLRVELGAERVVDAVDGVGDVGLGVLQQIGDLGADDRAHRTDEHQQQEDRTEQDQRRRPAAPPAAASQAVDTGFDRQRAEQRDQQQQHQAVDPIPQVLHQPGAQEPDPEHDDRRHDP